MAGKTELLQVEGMTAFRRPRPDQAALNSKEEKVNQIALDIFGNPIASHAKNDSPQRRRLAKQLEATLSVETKQSINTEDLDARLAAAAERRRLSKQRSQKDHAPEESKRAESGVRPTNLSDLLDAATEKKKLVLERSQKDHAPEESKRAESGIKPINLSELLDAAAQKKQEHLARQESKKQDLIPAASEVSLQKRVITTNYEDHASSMMNSVKKEYFNFLMKLKQENLSKTANEHGLMEYSTNFVPFYKNLSKLVSLLSAQNLDEYVLRYSDSNPTEAALEIERLSKAVVDDLVKFGFVGPPDDKPILFWSGSLAKEKVENDDVGLSDEQILLIQALWGLDTLICAKEKAKPAKEFNGRPISIHAKLIVAFSSILAQYAKGKTVDYYLGYENGAMNVASAFWKGELPVLKKLAAKVNLYRYDKGTWIGPTDLNDPKNEGALDALVIQRRDFGGERGPLAKQDSAITIGQAKKILDKWTSQAKFQRLIQACSSEA